MDAEREVAASPPARAPRAVRGGGRRRGVQRGLAATRCLGRAWLEARLVLPALAPAARRARGAALAAALVDALDVSIVRRGAPGMPDGATLVVANHVSWLDAGVLHAALPARFVVAAEVMGWPVLGAVARRLDAIAVRPGDVRDVRRTVAEVAAALRGGEHVVVFPEGGPTDGQCLGRFHSALLQAAVDTGAPVQPVAIRYLGLRGRPAAGVTRAGETRRGTSLVQILAAPYLRAELRFGTPLSVAGRTRRELAALARGFVAQSLGLSTATSGRDAAAGASDRRTPPAAAPGRSLRGRLVPAVG